MRSELFWKNSAAYIGNSLPTFRDSLSVPHFENSRFLTFGDEEIGCPESSVRNSHNSLRNSQKRLDLIYSTTET